MSNWQQLLQREADNIVICVYYVSPSRSWQCTRRCNM